MHVVVDVWTTYLRSRWDTICVVLGVLVNVNIQTSGYQPKIDRW